MREARGEEDGEDGEDEEGEEGENEITPLVTPLCSTGGTEARKWLPLSPCPPISPPPHLSYPAKLSTLIGTKSPLEVSPKNMASCGRINCPVRTQYSSFWAVAAILARISAREN